MEEFKGWHFIKDDRRLRYGDNRLVEPGKSYSVPDDRPLQLCDYGLHASSYILDALTYAPGSILCRVSLFGERIDGEDKSVAYKRTVHWMVNTHSILDEVGRSLAFKTTQFWSAPKIVIDYLKSGDKTLLGAAQNEMLKLNYARHKTVDSQWFVNTCEKYAYMTSLWYILDDLTVKVKEKYVINCAIQALEFNEKYFDFENYKCHFRVEVEKELRSRVLVFKNQSVGSWVLK